MRSLPILEAVDGPKSLKSLGERNARLLRLEEPHISPLTHYVRQIREATGLGGQIPFFDPLDGGVDAACLYLLEAPGARAVSSGFISRNNPDESAKNFFELNEKAGIPRKQTAIWNIVPWYIGSGRKIRAARQADLAAGLPHLQRMLDILLNLRIVIIMGQKPTFAEQHITGARPELEIVRSPHPSPLYVNNRPGNRDTILSALKIVSERLSGYAANR